MYPSDSLIRFSFSLNSSLFLSSMNTTQSWMKLFFTANFKNFSELRLLILYLTVEIMKFLHRIFFPYCESPLHDWYLKFILILGDHGLKILHVRSIETHLLRCAYRILILIMLERSRLVYLQRSSRFVYISKIATIVFVSLR